MESEPAGRAQGGSSQVFWWRLTDNLFRRIGWFLLPVVAMTLVGLSQARGTIDLYSSSATLSASTNPLVPDQPVGTPAQWFETPAASTSRIINEQLRTNSFLRAVTEAAGLGEALDSGFLSIEVVRSSIWAGENGDSILTVNAKWDNPQTSYQLATATIAQYEAYLTNTVSSASTEAEDFYTEQLLLLEAQHERAEEDLTSYVSDLPPLGLDETYPVSVQLETERLTSSLTSIESKIDDTNANIDAARLARAQQTNVAGRSFDVIDPPSVPTAPDSSLVKRGMLVVSFFMLGLVIATAALLVTTVLDKTVVSQNDLNSIDGIMFVATVPTVHIGSDRGSPGLLSSMRRRRASPGGRR